MFVHSAHCVDSIDDVRETQPKLWRRVRRFNRPVQLAVAAAERALRDAADPSSVNLYSIAPCQTGSPEVYAWAQKVGARTPNTRPIRANPTHSLHAVDNLALSAVAILVGSKARGVDIGGPPIKKKKKKEVAIEGGDDALVFAGDQASSSAGGAELGVALLLSNTAKPNAVRLTSIERVDAATPVSPTAHSALGLRGLIESLREATSSGRAIRYAVPAVDSDGLDEITIVGEAA